MGAKTDIFPTFSELCATAREVEKKPVSVPARPIDDKLVLDANFGIFPREFEEYTYSFLLFEAQKIERRLSADAYASGQQEQATRSRRLTPEQQMENDLHKFVSTQERASLDEEEDRLLNSLKEKKALAPPVPDEVADYERENQQPPGRDSGDAPVPDEDDAPLPEREVPIPPPPQARPRVLPPKISGDSWQKKPAVPSVAPAVPAARPIHQAPIAKPPVPQAQYARPTPQAAAPKPPEQDIFEPSRPIAQQPSTSLDAPSTGVEPERKPPAGASQYSKLSPRLQAIIEQKLRREEEKAKKAREDSDIFKTPPPEPEEESEEAEPGKALENIDAPNAWNLHDEEAAGKREEPVPSPPSEAEGRGQAGKNLRKLPLRKTDDEIAPLPEEEVPVEQEAMEEELPAPAKARPRVPVREEETAAAEEEEAAPAYVKARPRVPVREAPGEEEMPVPEEEEQPLQEVPAIKPLARKEKIQIAKSAISDEAIPAEEDEEKQAVPQPAPEEKEAPLPRARSQLQSGPVMIKPLFPDADVSGPSQEKKDISQAEDSDRMRRIQRIIEDLSPGKVRTVPKREDVSFEEQAVSKQIGEPADAGEDEEAQAPGEQAPQKAASGKKPKAQPAPLKGPAASQKKKTAAVQDDIAPAAVLLRKAAPMKKLQSKAQAEELSEEEAEETPVARKAAPKSIMRDEADEEMPAPAKARPRVPVREEEPVDAEEEEAAPAPRKPAPRMPVREVETEETEEEEPRPRRLAPRMPVRDEPEEEEAPAPVRARPRMPVREEPEEEETPAPARPLRKLMPRLPPREEPEEDDADEAQTAPASRLRRRILPGMGRTLPSTPQTYVPPARERKQAAQIAYEPEEEATQEEPEAEPEPVSPRVAPLRPRKLASDESLAAAEKTPEQILQEQKMAKMAEQLAKLEAGKVKEVAGTATMPVEEEDIPLPGDNEGVPKPEEYEQAKENLRKELEHEETARKVRQEDEAMVEQYAKDHMVWLYEIYKMGGMGRADFLEKASEKYSETQNAGQAAGAGAAADAPPNPALAALGKEIEKKDKK